MEAWWHHRAANPHSPHSRGANAAAAVEVARAQIADLIGAGRQEIVFTSGATESNNLAIIGVADAALHAGDSRREIIVSAIEHKSVLCAADSLKERGFRIFTCPVTSQGQLDTDRFADLLSNDTLLVSVMGANNEVGTLQPVDEVVRQVRSVGALIHVDIAQIAGKLPVHVAQYDYASISSHKLYGPMGIGALFVSAAAQYRPRPLFHGGSQESGVRPGTLATPLIVGFGAAASLASNRMAEDAQHASAMVSRLLAGLREAKIDFHHTSSASQRLPGSLSLQFVGIDSSFLINRLSERVCLSEGSACTSGQLQTSHVLTAMGLHEKQIRETVRLFCSRYNTSWEIDVTISALKEVIKNVPLASWTDPPVGLDHAESSF